VKTGEEGIEHKDTRKRSGAMGEAQEDCSWQDMPQVKQLKELDAARLAATL